jgi:hypothetical protein
VRRQKGKRFVCVFVPRRNKGLSVGSEKDVFQKQKAVSGLARHVTLIDIVVHTSIVGTRSRCIFASASRGDWVAVIFWFALFLFVIHTFALFFIINRFADGFACFSWARLARQHYYPRLLLLRRRNSENVLGRREDENGHCCGQTIDF